MCCVIHYYVGATGYIVLSNSALEDPTKDI